MIEHVKELGLDYDHADCKRFLEEIRDRENEAGEQLSLVSFTPLPIFLRKCRNI